MATDPTAAEELTDFQIDENRLDYEWQRQAELFQAYALGLAYKKERLLEEQRVLELTAAELALAIRRDPGRFKVPGGKATDKATEATVLVQPKYQAALQKVNKAKHRVSIAQIAVDALEHKKKALENMVVLHGRAYYADPRMDREVSPAVIADIKQRSKDAQRKAK